MAKPWLRIWGLRSLTHALSAFLVLKSGVEALLRYLGPIFAIFGFTLIGFAAFVHFSFVLPWYAEGPVLTLSLFSVIHLSMGVWLCVGIGYNYAKAVVTPPLDFGIELAPAELAVLNANAQNVSSRRNNRYCKYCQKGKVDRMHHCHICNTCIPGMDHHCPWISNCVGFHNHHYFVLFLLYLLAGCIYAGTMSFYPFCIALDSAKSWPYSTPRSSIVFAFVLASAVALSIAMLGGWQVYLILSGQTAVEYYIHRDNAALAAEVGRTYRNPHHQGIRKNFQRFFGVDASSWWFAWLVPGMANPTHNVAILKESTQQRVLDETV